MRLSYLVVLIAMSSGGCATITSSEYQPVSVATYDSKGEPLEKVRCQLQNDKGNWEVQAPGFVQVHRSSEDLLVQCKQEGQPDGSARAISRAATGMFGNIVFGGGVGAIIDHTKGTGYNYPDALNIRMGSAAIFDRNDAESATPVATAEAAAPAAQRVALSASVSASKSSATNSTVDPALPARMPRPGDIWKYRYVDGFSGSSKEVFVHEILAATAGRIEERMFVDGGGTVGDERAFTPDSALTLAERRLRNAERLEFAPYLQAFKQDLAFGQFGPITFPAPGGTPWEFTGRVMGNEIVSVPAGTFDALKIELSGTRRSALPCAPRPYRRATSSGMRRRRSATSGTT